MKRVAAARTTGYALPKSAPGTPYYYYYYKAHRRQLLTHAHEPNGGSHWRPGRARGEEKAGVAEEELVWKRGHRSGRGGGFLPEQGGRGAAAFPSEGSSPSTGRV